MVEQLDESIFTHNQSLLSFFFRSASSAVTPKLDLSQTAVNLAPLFITQTTQTTLVHGNTEQPVTFNIWYV